MKDTMKMQGAPWTVESCAKKHALETSVIIMGNALKPESPDLCDAPQTLGPSEAHGPHL